MSASFFGSVDTSQPRPVGCDGGFGAQPRRLSILMRSRLAAAIWLHMAADLVFAGSAVTTFMILASSSLSASTMSEPFMVTAGRGRGEDVHAVDERAARARGKAYELDYAFPLGLETGASRVQASGGEREHVLSMDCRCGSLMNMGCKVPITCSRVELVRVAKDRCPADTPSHLALGDFHIVA